MQTSAAKSLQKQKCSIDKVVPQPAVQVSQASWASCLLGHIKLWQLPLRYPAIYSPKLRSPDDLDGNCDPCDLKTIQIGVSPACLVSLMSKLLDFMEQNLLSIQLNCSWDWSCLCLCLFGSFFSKAPIKHLLFFNISCWLSRFFCSFLLSFWTNACLAFHNLQLTSRNEKVQVASNQQDARSSCFRNLFFQLLNLLDIVILEQDHI